MLGTVVLFILNNITVLNQYITYIYIYYKHLNTHVSHLFKQTDVNRNDNFFRINIIYVQLFLA